MSFLKNIFKKGDGSSSKASTHKGFNNLTILEVKRVTPETIQVSFDVPLELNSTYTFKSGQYLNLIVLIDGKEERRSYSICSGVGEPLAIAIKAVNKGKVSNWANEQLKAGEVIQVSKPEGNFILQDNTQKVVAFAAGSGITPIISMAKTVQKSRESMRLFYGNKDVQHIIFKEELSQLSKVKTTHFLSQENAEGYEYGRLTKDKISELIKSDLSILKADAYYLCGPEELILNARDLLLLFGVPKEKIHYELFTTPVLLKSEDKVKHEKFEGTSKIQVILDNEKINFDLGSSSRKTILDTINDLGYDAPYSCRGGVCCTCKAKVLEGKADMNLNYSLTDKEVEQGYILTCQAVPASEKLVISFDE